MIEACQDKNTESLDKGQYFTTSELLQEKVYSFILNKPECVLEPCVGKGHLVNYIQNKMDNINFDMYEIDETLEMIGNLNSEQVIYQNFLESENKKKYH